MCRHYLYFFACIVVIMLGGCNDSEEPLQQAHDLYEQSKQYKKEKDVERQVTTLMQAYKLLPQINNPALASQICQALGSAYMYRDLYDQSLAYCREAISYALQEEPHSKQLSLAYSQLGRTFAELHQTDSAMLYFEKALDQAMQLQDTTEIAVGYGQIGVVYRLQKDYTKALEYDKRELNIYLQHGDSSYIPQAYYGVGAAYYYMEQFDSAKVYFEKALHTDNIYTVQGSYQALYHINRKLGNLAEAIEYNQLNNTMKDSITKLARDEMLAEMQVKYENEKLLNQQTNLEIRNLRLTLFLIFSILAIIIIIMVGSRIYKYSQRKLAESKLKLQESEQIINQNQQEINRMTREIAETESNFNEKANLIMVQNRLLQKQNVSLMNYFSRNVPMLKKLKEHPKPIDDWTPIYELTDALQMDFYSRIKEEIPEMPEGSLNICCLIRLGFTTKQIASIVSIEAESLTKRKGRIRDEIMSNHPDLLNQKMPLDTFILSF